MHAKLLRKHLIPAFTAIIGMTLSSFGHGADMYAAKAKPGEWHLELDNSADYQRFAASSLALRASIAHAQVTFDLSPSWAQLQAETPATNGAWTPISGDTRSQPLSLLALESAD